MRGGDDHSQKERMFRCAPRADKISRHDGLAVTRLQSMERTQPRRDKGCQQGNSETDFLCSYQFGERIAWAALPVRRQSHLSAARIAPLPHTLAFTAGFVRFSCW